MKVQIQNANQLGPIVKTRRLAKGWSQKDLSKRAMVSLRWLILLEKRQNIPRLDLVIRTLNALGLNMSVQIPAADTLEEILKP